MLQGIEFYRMEFRQTVEQQKNSDRQDDAARIYIHVDVGERK